MLLEASASTLRDRPANLVGLAPILGVGRKATCIRPTLLDIKMSASRIHAMLKLRKLCYLRLGAGGCRSGILELIADTCLIPAIQEAASSRRNGSLRTSEQVSSTSRHLFGVLP